MSITRDYGMITFICDNCGNTLETKTDDFDAARDKLIGEDWQTRKHRGDWEHTCPDCQESR